MIYVKSFILIFSFFFWDADEVSIEMVIDKEVISTNFTLCFEFNRIAFWLVVFVCGQSHEH